MKDNLLVSIIIPNHNYGKYLGEAIDSALQQTYSNVEVIVVDDGSTDNSREVIASYGNKVIAVLKENGGQASSFNAGYAVSQGEIICFLDSDDVFIPTKVERIVEIFHQHPEIEWCFHPLNLIDKQSGKVLAISRSFPNTDKEDSMYCDFRKDLQQGRLPFYVPPTSGLCLTRSLLQKFAPIPENRTFTPASDDHFYRYCAVAASPGFYINEYLSYQGIHTNNTVSSAQFKMILDGKEMVAAHFLKSKFPEASRFSDRVFSRNLSQFWKTKFNNPKQQEEFKKFISFYFSECSVQRRLKIVLMAIYQSRPWKQGYTHRFLSSS